jgi:hypothetical protein
MQIDLTRLWWLCWVEIRDRLIVSIGSDFEDDECDEGRIFAEFSRDSEEYSCTLALHPNVIEDALHYLVGDSIMDIPRTFSTVSRILSDCAMEMNKESISRDRIVELLHETNTRIRQACEKVTVKLQENIDP